MKRVLQSVSVEAGMLAQFRRKFVATNMIFAGVVLVLVLAVVVVNTYYGHLEDVYRALDSRIEIAKSRGDLMQGSGRVINENSGATGNVGADAVGFADNFGTREEVAGDGSAALRQPEEAPPGEHGSYPPGDDRGHRAADSDQFVATSLYLLDGDWEPQIVYDEAFPIDDNTLIQALAQARSENEDSIEAVETGRLGTQNLFYQIEPYGGGYLATFASGYYIERNMNNTLVPLMISELVALLAFFVISLILARWAVRPVERAWDQQQRFIADASHELKTPLTVIRANDSILLSQPDATIQDQQQWIESTETEAQIMQDLVNDMLFLAKADAAKVSLEYSTVCFSDVVREQLLQFESVAFEKGIDMSINIADNVTVNGDASSLQRLVGTLVDNACKYCGDQGKVEVSLSEAGNACSLKVRNTGSAIAAEDLKHVFDRFYRSDKARTRSGGYGLGLAIAKSIVEDHKGKIWVTSTEAEGTTFTVELPVL